MISGFAHGSSGFGCSIKPASASAADHPLDESGNRQPAHHGGALQGRPARIVDAEPKREVIFRVSAH
jgi:hypothetical protein